MSGIGSEGGGRHITEEWTWTVMGVVVAVVVVEGDDRSGGETIWWRWQWHWR